MALSSAAGRVAFVAFLTFTLGGTCNEDEELAGDVTGLEDFTFSVILLNQDLENIHIFRDVLENFSPANRLEPTGTRTVEVTAEVGDRISWVAGRDGERFDEQQCVVGERLEPDELRAPLRSRADLLGTPPFPQVVWGGNPIQPSLSCVNWN